jgi:hypothetical protein
MFGTTFGRQIGRRGSVAVSIVVLAVGGLFIGGGTAVSAPEVGCPEPIQTPSGDEVLDRDDLPPATDVIACDLVGVSVDFGEVELEVPEPGYLVEVDSFDESGFGDAILAVDVSGAVNFDPADVPESPSAPAACDDTAYNRLASGPLYENGETVYADRASIPSVELNRDDTMVALEDALRAWPQQFNDCGMSDQVARTINWGGNAAYTNSVIPAGCQSAGSNTTSIMGFVDYLPVPGRTCRYAIQVAGGVYYTLGADIAFVRLLPGTSSVGDWTLTGGSASCSNEMDLPSVATHESGHLFGLDHVSKVDHPHLTMRGGGLSSILCKTKLRTLGKGDVFGMRQLD